MPTSNTMETAQSTSRLDNDMHLGEGIASRKMVHSGRIFVSRTDRDREFVPRGAKRLNLVPVEFEICSIRRTGITLVG